MRDVRSLLRSLIVFSAISSSAWVRAALQNPDMLVFLDVYELETVDPAWANTHLSRNLVANLYDPLIAFKGSSVTEFEPRLASAVPSRQNGLLSPDGRLYRFPIRKGVKFHDGGEMTPEDVKYSLMRFLLTDPDDSPASGLLRDVLGRDSTRGADGTFDPGLARAAERAIRVDGDSVLVELPRPSAAFLGNMAAASWVMSRSWAARQGAWDGAEATVARHNNPKRQDDPLNERENGTGPFRLERWDKTDRTAHLTRFEGYWRGPARLKRVVIKTVEDFATRKLMLSAGDADVIAADGDVRPQLEGIQGVSITGGLRLFAVNPIVYFNILASTSANPFIGSGRLDGAGIPPDFFADIDVRKGIAYAIDYDAYVREVLRGRGNRARSFLPSGVPGHNPDQPAYRLDLEKARRHFRRAFDGRLWQAGFKVGLTYPSGSSKREVLCQMLKRNLEALNPKFSVELRKLNSAAYADHVRARRLPFWAASVAGDSADPHGFAYYLLHSQATALTGYKNPEADRLIEDAAMELDAPERALKYRRLQEIAFEDVAFVPIAEEESYRVQRSWVRGYVFNPAFPGAPARSDYFALWKQASFD